MLNAIENFKKGEMETGKADFPESEESFSIAGFPHAMYTFIAQAVKLRVDPVTGQVVRLDIAAATEAGRIINPLAKMCIRDRHHSCNWRVAACPGRYR